MQILDDIKFQNFLESNDLRPNTKEIYTASMKKFCNFLDRTPSELISECREDQENIAWIDDRRIYSYFLKFKKYLETCVDERKNHPNTKLSYNTCLAYMRCVRIFFNHFNIALPNVKIKQNKDEQIRQTIEDIPNKEHISKALEFANVKYRAIITLMASSGMAQADIRNLNIGNLYVSLGLPIPTNFPLDISDLIDFVKNNPDYCPMFHLTRVKTSIDFTTFCTPESLNFIINYIESLYGHDFFYMSADDKLFQGYSSKPGANTGIEKYFRRLNRLADFGNSHNGRSSFFTSHKLRKHFTSVLYQNNVPELSIHWYLGHKIPINTEAYFKMSVKTHRKEYERIVPNLTFSDKVKIVEKDANAYYDIVNRMKREQIDMIENSIAQLDAIAKAKGFDVENSEENKAFYDSRMKQLDMIKKLKEELNSPET